MKMEETEQDVDDDGDPLNGIMNFVLKLSHIF
jgi:hypothetical protein